jgi:urea transport system permease protein
MNKTTERVVTGLFLLIFLLALPALNLAGMLETNTLTLWGRYACFAIAAIGVDLVWGYTGIMTMCHAFFFCLGAYGMGMYMTVANLPEAQQVPDFMLWNQVEALPAFWLPFRTLPGAILSGLAVTGIFAFLFSYFIFRRRIRGVFFAIITQAFALAMYLLFSRNETMLGGSNGLTHFRRLLDFDLYLPQVKLGLYVLTILVLALVYFLAQRLTASKFGKVLIGIRDSESRLRFTGYNVVSYQTTIFVAGALIAALAGMLYLPQTGIITPGRMDVKASIEMLIWVALGGRGNLKGAILGALVVNALYSLFTSLVPQAWPYVLGALYLVTVLYMPRGLVGLLDTLRTFFSRKITKRCSPSQI